MDGYWLTSEAAGTAGQARYLETGWTSPSLRATLSVLDLQDGFRADVGFVPRPAIRKYYGSLRVPVHPAWAQAAGFSEIAIGGFADYFAGADGHFQTARAQESLEVTRRDSTKATLTRDDSHEVITTPFGIGRTLQVQPGDSRYGSWQAVVSSARAGFQGIARHACGASRLGSNHTLVSYAVTREAMYGSSRCSVPQMAPPISIQHAT